MNHQTSIPTPVVLTIAGFDPSGGAGISADLKTFAAHDCYGVAVITAFTIQNTQGAKALHAVESSLVKESVECLLANERIRAVKIGMLVSRRNAEVVCDILDSNSS